MAGMPPSDMIDELVGALRANSFSKMQNCVTNILAEGFAVINILTCLSDRVRRAQNFSFIYYNDYFFGNFRDFNIALHLFHLTDVFSMLGQILIDDNISDVNKAQMAIRIAEANKCLVDGADELLQFMAVCSLGVQCFSAKQQLDTNAL